MTESDILDRYTGCLLGGAIGDALGWPVEFHALEEIRDEYGPEGVIDFVEADGGIGAVTDDTQMTLFTAEGLLSVPAEASVNAEDYLPALHEAYLRWLRTQEEAGPLPADAGLAALPELHARRAPGTTCLSALQSGRAGTVGAQINDSKGCGGVMRVAPVGLHCAARHVGKDPAVIAREAFALGSAAAAITHGHPSGFLSAGALAGMVALLVAGMPLEAAVLETAAILKVETDSGECLGAIESALSLWRKVRGTATPETVEKLGEGWTGEEALAIAVFCALAAEGDFRKGVLLAVNHSGDSDSTGAVTGNLLGALLGAGAIPKRWKSTVEMQKTLEEMAGRLLAPPSLVGCLHL